MPDAAIAPGKPARPGVYHGWYVALAAFLSTGFAVGMGQYAFGVFVEPLEEEFGWSRAQINASLSIGLLASLLSPPVGAAMDRLGTRPVLFVSLLFMAAGFAVAAAMASLWQFYLFSVLLYCGFAGATVLQAGKLIALWFPETRGRMMGLVTAGNNFGGLTMVPLATVIAAAAGWRWAYVLFAALVLALALASLFIVRDDPAAVARARAARRGADGRGPAIPVTGLTVREVARMPSFYLITIGLTAASFTYYAVLTQLLPHLKAVGFSEGAAATGVMLVALFGIGSKLSFGWLSEKVTARRAVILSLGIQTTALTLLILAGGSGMVWPAVILFGSGYGGLGALIPLAVAEAFGVRHLGSVLGLVTLASVVPVVAGPLMAGVIFDRTGSYDLSFTITIGFFALGAVCMLLARPARRPRQPGGWGPASSRANESR